MLNFFKQLFQGSNNDHISPQDTYTELQSKTPPLLLDVRQQDEYKAGHVAGALLIPLDQLAKRQGELPKARAIVCICRSGSRSGSASQLLREAGFNVRNVRGGLMAWQAAGLPVVRGK